MISDSEVPKSPPLPSFLSPLVPPSPPTGLKPEKLESLDCDFLSAITSLLVYWLIDMYFWLKQKTSLCLRMPASIESPFFWISARAPIIPLSVAPNSSWKAKVWNIRKNPPLLVNVVLFWRGIQQIKTSLPELGLGCLHPGTVAASSRHCSPSRPRSRGSSQLKHPGDDHDDDDGHDYWLSWSWWWRKPQAALVVPPRQLHNSRKPNLGEAC